MTTALQANSGKKNNVSQSKFLEDRAALNEDSMNRISEALRSTKDLKQLVNQVTSATKPRKADENSEFCSPLGRKTMSASKSYGGPVSFFQPMEPLDSSDEDECTFHPKTNNKARHLSQRIIPNGDTNEFLYRYAADRQLKKQEYEEINGGRFDQRTKITKIGPKSVQIVFKKLQQAIKNLIAGVESGENPGFVNFEGLGTLLYRIGVFQNLEFKPQEDNPERSSVSINHARVKPERLAREITFHENMWKICSLASSDQNWAPADLVFKFMLVLVEEKTEVVESASFLLESIDRALEANGASREENRSPYLESKDEKGLWGLEKLVVEFRRLFDDKTSFMNFYSFNNSSSYVTEKKDQLVNKYYSHAHKPQINRKSQQLDARYFSQTLPKKMETAQVELNHKDLKERHMRLYHYQKYLTNKKNVSLEAKIVEELAPCTFAPAITPYKKKQRPGTANQSVEQGSVSPSKSGYFNQALDDNLGSKRQLLMYEVAHHYKEKLHQKAYALKKREEIQELSHCTFEPKLNKNYEYSEVRYQDFYEGVPNGFKRIVERLHKGTEDRKNKQEELERIPRGENYAKNRSAPFNPPSQLERPKIKRKEVLVYVDVSIGHGRTGRIGIHKGDNAKSLARHFARTYSLNATMQDSLEKLLQSYIDSYFAQSPQNEIADQGQEDDEKYHGMPHDDEEEEDEEEGDGVEQIEEEDEEDDHHDQRRY